MNCAYMGPLPICVEHAGQKALSLKSKPYLIGPEDFFSGPDKLRSKFAKLVNIHDKESIAFIPSVSYGLANVIKNVKPDKGQEILLVEETFPSNYYPWKRLADDYGAVLKIIRAPSAGAGRGSLWNEALLHAINEKTCAVSLPQVHWADGTKFDLEAVREITNKYGALLVIDGSQSIGALPFNVQELKPDALITVGYKWMLGAYGFGFAYYNERFEGAVPVEENWINRLQSEDFQRLVNYQDEYKSSSHRFNFGEYSQLIAIAMLTESLELIQTWGVESIQDYCHQISAPCIEALQNLGCFIESEEYRGKHLFGVRMPEDADITLLKKVASEEKVFVSFRGSAVRISAHLYNEVQDFERLLRVFKKVL